MYEKMYHDLRDNEKKIDAELDQIQAQYNTASNKKEAIYAKLSARTSGRETEISPNG